MIVNQRGGAPDTTAPWPSHWWSFCNQTGWLGASCAIRTSEMALEADNTNRLCLQMPHHLCNSWYPPHPRPKTTTVFWVWRPGRIHQVPWQWQWTVCHHYFHSPFITLASSPRPNAPGRDIVLKKKFSIYDERKTNEMHFQSKPYI
jgi:hypothetical protein